MSEGRLPRDGAATEPAPAPDRPSDALAARGTFRLLLDPTFGPFFAAKNLWSIGAWIHNIAAAILVWELTGSALLVGAVSVAQFSPQIVLAPWAGSMADRLDRRRQLIAGRAIGAVASGGLAAWIALFGLEGASGAGIVIAASLVFGLGFVVGLPAMHALLPALVRPSELPTAVAINSLPMTLARAVGPAVGALLVAGPGFAAAFAVATALGLTFAVILALITIRPQPRRTSGDRSMSAGWRYVRQDAAMLALLLGVAAVGVGADPVITLTPAVAARLGEGSSFVGVLASAFGVGAAVGFLSLGRVQRAFALPQVATAGLLALAGGLLLLMLSPVPSMAVASMVVGGVGMAFGMTALTTMVQQRVPDELRGRVMALWGVGFLGARPISAGVAGTLTDLLSVEVALAVVVAVVLAATLLVRPGRIGAAVAGDR